MDSLNYYEHLAYSTDEKGDVTGSGVYVENSDIEIEGVPSEGCHFVQWNDFNNENPRSVHITQDSTFIAQFSINQYNVELAVQDTLDMGTIEGSGDYEHGEIVNISADENKGYVFLYWLESDTIVSTEAEETTGTTNGHDWVDLGLPSGLKWATCNVGAVLPGECREKRMGHAWRMPTYEEQEELLNNCSWELTTENGFNGYKVTGPNGNYIFLPVAGYRYGSTLNFDG